MAAVSTIGNSIYINQNMHTQAALHAGEQNRFQIQVLAQVDGFNEKARVVEEVRPPENSHGIDPDREREKKGFDQNQEEKKESRGEKKQEEERPRARVGLLDITV